MNDPQDRNLIAVNEREVEDFERSVYGRRYEEAGRLLIAILPKLHRVYDAPGYMATPEVEGYLYTRLGAAVTALLADEKFTLGRNGFETLALWQPILSVLPEAGAFGGSDHLVRLIGSRDAGAPQKLNFPHVQQQLKLLLAYSLDSDIELDFESIFRQDPSLMFPAYLGMLGRFEVLTRNAERRRAQLLCLGPMFEQVVPRVEHMAALAVVWMNCMYGTNPGRHAIKRPLNALARRVAMAGQTEVLERGGARRRRALAERPVMLVPLEHFRAAHVNYRSYAALIRRLRERFTLVGAGTSVDFDDTSRGLFDRLVEFARPDERGFGPLLAALNAVEADIVFYPTLGIQWWWIAVANLRLAPIQAMTMGVPATTYSPVMDYVLMEESWAGDPDCYSETLIHTRAGSTRFQRRNAGAGREVRGTLDAGAPLRIAVPALVTKLNAPFLETCQQIAQQSRVPLEWHFFPGMSGLHHVIAKGQILRWFPHATVYGYLEYPRYIETLARCDLHLSTFPFGGTNTNLDSMQLGIPMITLEGREAHSQIDAGMIRRTGLPDWLIARTPEEYVNTALKLIHSPEERAKVRRQLLATPVEDIFTETDSSAPDDFVEAFCWLYDQHEAIQRAKRKCWTVADRDPSSASGDRGVRPRPAVSRKRSARARRPSAKPDRARRARD
jgi:hypothetical protein